MKNLLEGKKGIIFGALDEQSIAWQTALKTYNEGGRFVLTNTRLALRKGDINQLAKSCEAEIIPADATDVDDLERLFTQTLDIFDGKIDFILHAIGMSPNVRKARNYTDLNYDFFHKTIDVSALSFHKILQTAYKLDALNQWGSVVALSYIGAQRVFDSYGDMAQAKAVLESIAQYFGYHYGKHKQVRINTISQSPTKTTAGNGIKGFGDFYKLAECMSPLGNATAEECADICVMLFSDYSKKITMQNLFHDGGFSAMGIREDCITNYKDCKK